MYFCCFTGSSITNEVTRGDAIEWNDKPMCETMIRLPSNYHYALLKIYTRT